VLLTALASTAPVLPGVGVIALLLLFLVAVLVLVEGRLFLRPNTARPEGALRVTRTIDRSIDLGESATVTLRVRNRLGLPVTVRVVESVPDAFDTEVPFEELFPVHARVPAHGAVDLAYTVIPRHRGRVEIPEPWVRVGISAGLAMRRYQPACRSATRVVPALSAVVRYDTLQKSRNLAALGIHVGRGFTRGREFDRLREYHQDDDFRDIDWKATARRGNPISRVYRPERSQDVIVAVDASRVMTARAGELSKLDEAVNAALVLAHVVTQGGDRFGLLVFDSEARTWMAPRSGKTTVRRALDVLYDVAPSPFDGSFRAACTALATRQTRRALIVFLTDFPDRVAGDDFLRCLPLLRARHLVTCFTVVDRDVVELAEHAPSDRRELATSLAAAELIEEKRRARRRVTEGGAQCIELPPGDLAAASVNRYLEAKSRGLL